VSLADDSGAEDEPVEIDPVAMAYLAFLERDMAEHPERLAPFTSEELDGLAALLKDVEVSDDERLADDVTF
jgi:antitoxin PrlF